jgi:hypothetical protein
MLAAEFWTRCNGEVVHVVDRQAQSCISLTARGEGYHQIGNDALADASTNLSQMAYR